MNQCPYCAEEVKVGLKPQSAAVLDACQKCLNIRIARAGTGGRWDAEPLPDNEDIHETISEGSVMAGVFAQLPEEFEDLPALPEIPRQIIGLIHDPLASMSDVADLINKDAALVLRVLRVANSAFYGGRVEIKDIRTACSRLGMRTVANLVLAVGNGSLYRSHDARFRGLMGQLWEHSIVSAHCAGALSGRVEQEYAPSLFLAGLLHDIGKVVLLDVITVKYRGPTGRLKESEDLLKHVLERFHTLVGLHVAQQWRLPPEFRMTSYCHEAPETSPDPQWARVIHAVALASKFAHAMGYGWEESDENLNEHPSAVFLGLDPVQMEELRAKLEDQVNTLVGAFVFD